MFTTAVKNIYFFRVVFDKSRRAFWVSCVSHRSSNTQKPSYIIFIHHTPYSIHHLHTSHIIHTASSYSIHHIQAHNNPSHTDLFSLSQNMNIFDAFIYYLKSINNKICNNRSNPKFTNESLHPLSGLGDEVSRSWRHPNVSQVYKL